MRQLQRSLDVSVLAGLVAARQQDHDLESSLCEIHAVARPRVDAQLGHPFAHRLAIAKMAELDKVDTRLNPPFRLAILEAQEPIVEDRCGVDWFSGSAL